MVFAEWRATCESIQIVVLIQTVDLSILLDIQSHCELHMFGVTIRIFQGKVLFLLV